MTITVQGRPFPVPPSTGPGGLLTEAPALSRVDWLPDGAFPELDELRAEHVRLHEAALAVARETGELRRRYEEEDAAQGDALRAQAAGEDQQLPERTLSEERAAALAPLEAKARAITQVREQFARDAVATITEKYEGWATELDERDAEAEHRVAEAEAALQKEQAGLGANTQLRSWLERTAGRHFLFKDLDGRHIAYADLAGAGPEATQPISPVEPAEGEGQSPDLSPDARAQLLAARAARSDHTTEGGSDE